jgi:hypothetical protein
MTRPPHRPSAADRVAQRQQQAQPAAPPASAASTNDYGVVTEQTTTIDGHRYTPTLYPGVDGFRHLSWLVQVAAGPGGVLATSLGHLLVGSEGAAEIRPGDVTGALLDTSAVFEGAGGAAKLKELLIHTHVKTPHGISRKVSDDFDAWSQGRYGHVMRVVKWVLAVNFGPFSSGGPSVWIARLQEIGQSFGLESSPPPPASTSPTESGSTSNSPSTTD